MFQYYFKNKSKEALTATLKTKRNRSRNSWKLASFSEVVNYLLQTFDTDEVISKAHAQAKNYLQLDRMSPPAYADELWNKVLRYGTEYTEDG